MTPPPLAFSVLGKPFGKGRPRFTARVVFPKEGGRPIAVTSVYTPEATRRGEAIIRAAAERFMAGRKPLHAPLMLTVRDYFEPPARWGKAARTAALAGLVPHTAKPDFDNLAKVVDALNGVVWTDDSLITDALISKRYGRPHRVEIIVQHVDMAGKMLSPDWLREPARPDPFAREPQQRALFAE